jgi:hypothetical protein
MFSKMNEINQLMKSGGAGSTGMGGSMASIQSGF